MLSYIRGAPFIVERPPPRKPLDWKGRALTVLLVTTGLILFILFLVMIWLHDQTRLHVLNLQILIVLFGALVMFAPLKETPSISSYRPKPGSIGAKMVGISFFVFGALIFCGGSALLIGDVVYPWRVIEGRVDGIMIRYGRRLPIPEYRIIIDGNRYSATHDVYSEMHVGDRVRAEMGIGSKTLFRVSVREAAPTRTPPPGAPIPYYPLPSSPKS